MKEPLVSVLIPVYNCADTLEDCLKSIVQQSLLHFEAIIVNDGSTDKTSAILNEYASHDVRLKIIQTPNQGIVPALNLGLEQCVGKYIARMDGDDIMLPKRLETQLEFMEANPYIDISGCLVDIFVSEGDLPSSSLRYQQWSNSLISEQAILSEIFVESPLMHPTFFAKRSIFSLLEGYRDYPWAEDYDLLLRAWSSGKRLGKIPQILLKKRDAPQRLSRTDSRYKRPAMFRAKVHYLRESGVLQQKKGVLLAGTGPSGREIARCFQEQQIPILGFLDNLPGPPDRTVMNIPAWGFKDEIPDSFIKPFEEAIVIICVGDKTGREALITYLKRNDFEEGRNIIRFV